MFCKSKPYIYALGLDKILGVYIFGGNLFSTRSYKDFFDKKSGFENDFVYTPDKLFYFCIKI
ncbi:MAG: hypothetical protein DRI73_05430 [Bacteroidetes bacterium]|nr:MAG: hypothetical protein DRI73_05430 [Bacteroidota bacterium]